MKSLIRAAPVRKRSCSGADAAPLRLRFGWSFPLPHGRGSVHSGTFSHTLCAWKPRHDAKRINLTPYYVSGLIVSPVASLGWKYVLFCGIRPADSLTVRRWAIGVALTSSATPDSFRAVSFASSADFT